MSIVTGERSTLARSSESLVSLPRSLFSPMTGMLAAEAAGRFCQHIERLGVVASVCRLRKASEILSPLSVKS